MSEGGRNVYIFYQGKEILRSLKLGGGERVFVLSSKERKLLLPSGKNFFEKIKRIFLKISMSIV